MNYKRCHDKWTTMTMVEGELPGGVSDDEYED